MTWPALLAHTQMERDNAVDERNTLRSTLEERTRERDEAVEMHTLISALRTRFAVSVKALHTIAEDCVATHECVFAAEEALALLHGASPAAQKDGQ